MNTDYIEIKWPNGKSSQSIPGNDWIEEARKAGFSIPTGCLTGSCGACEIEVNGELIRACISQIPGNKSKKIKVEIYNDPYW